MNDPGTAEPIQEAANEVEPVVDSKEEEHKTEQDKHDYNDHTRYWFAATGCPLAASTLGPLANTFSILALAQNWRVYTPKGTAAIHGIRIHDPGWLIAVNAVSLLLAIVANFLLLMNLAERIRFRLAQPVCIVGFSLAAVLLIADMAALSAAINLDIPQSSPAADSGRHALTSAFYYALEAAVLYIIVVALMCWTAWGAFRGHFEAQFRLSPAQRTLMLQTMAFLTYLLLGALVFSHVEEWKFLDAVYWADLTLLTIGLGTDFHPSTHTGRSLLFPFAIGGIVIIGLVIGSIRTLVLEKGKRKISARMLENKRQRAVHSIDPGHHRITLSWLHSVDFDNDLLDAAGRRRLEFNAMRKIQHVTHTERRWMALAISATAACALWFLGALVFHKTEYQQHWSYFDALYFCYVCLLTIGYGDYYPQSESGRAFFVLWTLLAVPTLTILISDMSDTVVAGFSTLVMRLSSYTNLKNGAKRLAKGHSSRNRRESEEKNSFAPGLLGEGLPAQDEEQTEEDTDRPDVLVSNILERLALHLADEELQDAKQAAEHGDDLERDIHFYHFVLARELRKILHDLNASPSKKYTWEEWEYYLKLAGADDESTDLESPLQEDAMVPKALQSPRRVAAFAPYGKKQDFSWLSDQSPLLHHKSESEWILERLSMTLERELHESRPRTKRNASGIETGHEPRKPPISLGDLINSGQLKRRAAARPRSEIRSSEKDGQV